MIGAWCCTGYCRALQGGGARVWTHDVIMYADVKMYTYCAWGAESALNNIHDREGALINIQENEGALINIETMRGCVNKYSRSWRCSRGWDWDGAVNYMHDVIPNISEWPPKNYCRQRCDSASGEARSLAWWPNSIALVDKVPKKGVWVPHQEATF
jgi:hypothetical protein